MIDRSKLFDILIEQAPVGFCLFDTDLRCMLINNYLAAVDGLPVHAHIGKSIEEIIPTVWPSVKPYTDHLLATGSPVSGEVFGETPLLPGVKRYWNLSLLPYRDDEGKLIGLAAIVNETTGQKLAEEAILERKDLLEGINRILQSALTCITETELGLVCLDVIIRLTRSRIGFIGERNPEGLMQIAAVQPCSEHVLPNLEPFKIHGIYGRVIQSGESVLTNDPANHPDSIGLPPRHPHLSSFLGVPMTRDGRVCGILAVGNREDGYTMEEQEMLEALSPTVVEAFQRKRARDALESFNRALEQKVEQRTSELLHAEKLAAIGRLSASFAHEFNSPLQAIMTILKIFEMSSTLNPEERKFLAAAIDEGKRMKDLIGSLRDFHKPSSGRKVLMDVHATIDSVLLLCKFDFNRNKILTSMHYAENLPQIKAIPDQIKQVFLNLLTNAADACLDRGGIILIRTWQEGPIIAVEIQDTGVGIPLGNLEKIFQPFFTTKPAVKGTGLGLSVCHGIVQSHGGTIRVESEPGAGSIVTVYLPINI